MTSEDTTGSANAPGSAGSADGAARHVRDTARVLLHDGAGRVLLFFPNYSVNVDRPPRWITPGGGIDPGETPEAAATRELFEETGLVVDTLTPAGDQPWPNPHQLLVAFAGTTPDVRDHRLTEELEAICVLTRAELRTALAAGELVVPPPRSLAGVLVGAWLGGGSS